MVKQKVKLESGCLGSETMHILHDKDKDILIEQSLCYEIEQSHVL